MKYLIDGILIYLLLVQKLQTSDEIFECVYSYSLTTWWLTLEEWLYDSPLTPIVLRVTGIFFDEYFRASTNVDHLVSEALSPVSVGSTGSSSSFFIDQDAPSKSIPQIAL